jgi:chromosome segregation ATPase
MRGSNKPHGLNYVKAPSAVDSGFEATKKRNQKDLSFWKDRAEKLEAELKRTRRELEDAHRQLQQMLAAIGRAARSCRTVGRP